MARRTTDAAPSTEPGRAARETPSRTPPATPDLPADWVRMVLPTAILGVVADQALHGYGIARTLGVRGLGTPRGGSLYPVLARLERDGLITAQWRAGESGPGRKEYTITDRGRERLDSDRRAWTALGDVLWAPVTIEEDA